MRTSSQIVGPHLTAIDQCEAILRSVPQWFGIEEALIRFASDTARLPTFAIQDGERLEAFLTLRELSGRRPAAAHAAQTSQRNVSPARDTSPRGDLPRK